MGITSACIIARASFYALCVQSSNLQALLMDLAGPHPQRNLLRIICENLSTMETAKFPLRQRDMLAVRNEKESVPWYGALPSKPLGNYIPPNQFRVAFKFQFDSETLRNNVGEKKCEACKQQMDPFGMHGAKCHTEGGLTKRHNVTRDMLHKQAMDAGKQSETERKEILNDGTNIRPADVYIQNYSMIQALAVDVAVVDGGGYQFQEKYTKRLKLIYGSWASLLATLSILVFVENFVPGVYRTTHVALILNKFNQLINTCQFIAAFETMTIIELLMSLATDRWIPSEKKDTRSEGSDIDRIATGELERYDNRCRVIDGLGGDDFEGGEENTSSPVSCSRINVILSLLV
jgi:hypothetical protein